MGDSTICSPLPIPLLLSASVLFASWLISQNSSVRPGLLVGRVVAILPLKASRVQGDDSFYLILVGPS